RDGQEDATRTVDVVMGAALLVSRELLLAHGGWDERYTFGGEDIDLCARIGRTHEVVYCPAAEVIHHGRVSSRLRGGYAYSKTLIGITRALKCNGTSSAALLLYKTAVTIDAPLRWLENVGQYLWRKLTGRR